METEKNNENEMAGNARLSAGSQQVLFAQSPDGNRIVGVVTHSPPSSLALLAAGVAGMAARGAIRSGERNNP